MRRPRSKLQVSTFPFLAVLLCAKGSLLLLLFIMDRRAKIAARCRVNEELQTRQARTKAEEEARQAEWEKAKEQLHLSLLQVQDQLRADTDKVQHDQGGVAKRLAVVHSRYVDLDHELKKEGSHIGALQLDIAGRRTWLQQADKKETLSKAELIEAARELGELERAFEQLRALKEREKQTYSVVPYRGKRGDARPPIYIECTRQGVIFHPEKKLLQTWEITPEAIRAEVERRHGPLVVRKAAKDKSKPAGDESPITTRRWRRSTAISSTSATSWSRRRGLSISPAPRMPRVRRRLEPSYHGNTRTPSGRPSPRRGQSLRATARQRTTR